MSEPRYPSLYQINTRVWMTELSQTLGRPAWLDDIPDAELDRLTERGFDEWNGDDLRGKGLFLDIEPWQACVFSVSLQ